MTSAVDLLLGSEQGNSAFAMWTGGTEQSIYLEAIQWWSWSPRPACTPTGFSRRHHFGSWSILGELMFPRISIRREKSSSPARFFNLLDNGRIKQKLLPGMLEKSRQHAGERSAIIAQTAVEKMQAALGQEVERLQDLRKVNDHVREDEITLLQSQMAELETKLQGSAFAT